MCGSLKFNFGRCKPGCCPCYKKAKTVPSNTFKYVKGGAMGAGGKGGMYRSVATADGYGAGAGAGAGAKVAAGKCNRSIQ